MIILLKKLSLIFVFLFLIPTVAYAADNSASSAIVIDAKTNTILYEKNAYEQRAVASTTKIMTALIALESGRLEETVHITAEMVNVEGSSMGLRENDELTFYDLVCGMMLSSGNDSANAVAVFLAGSNEAFSVLMNKRAEELGMKNTYFVTPSGLDEGDHHSTAYDMALLTAKAVSIDIFCDIVSKQSAEITINGKKQTLYNHNRLLAMDEDIFGVKTGYTEKAGRCLVSAKHYEGNTLICVTLNCPDDWNDHMSLLNECEGKYFEAKAENIREISLVGAQKDKVRCSYAKTYYTLYQLKIEEYYYPFVYAPVKKGDKIGEALVYYNDELLERLPITADEDVEYYVWEQSNTTSEIHG